MGESAWDNGTTGDNNVIIGKDAGGNMASGDNSVMIGATCIGNATSHSNVAVGQGINMIANIQAVAIGKGISSAPGSNSVTIGESASGAVGSVTIGRLATGVAGKTVIGSSTHGSDEIRVPGLHNVGSNTTGGPTVPCIASGTYEPTAATFTNITAVTEYSDNRWTRVGNVVTVSGMVNIQPTTGGILTSFSMTLPIPSTFAVNRECTGTATLVGMGAVTGVGTIVGATTTAFFSFQNAVSTAALDYVYSYSYEVL